MPVTTIDYVPQPKQALMHYTEATEVLFGGAAGGGKLLTLDTPIPTPFGWVNNGDLRVGSSVFDENGKICTVTKLFDIEESPELYRLRFDDGSEIDCCKSHLWVTYDSVELAALTRRNPDWITKRRINRPSRATGNNIRPHVAICNSKRVHEYLPLPTGTVRTTQEIVDTLKCRGRRNNHAIRIAKPIQTKHVDLPIDPYVLGAWLGDGSKNGGGFTGIDLEILEEIEKAGFKIKDGKNKKSHYIQGLTPLLRIAGVLNNKHIPEIYLRASVEQRMALLQGLMDTDGTVATHSGSAEFCNTNEKIIDGIYELIVSLGWKATKREGRARLYGNDCGPKWTIKWTASEYVFRLRRKRDLQKLSTRRTTQFRYIVSAEKIPSRPGRCISVDSPSSLYLAGRSFIPTHNSKSMRMDALMWCLTIPGIQVYLFRRTFPELEKTHIIASREEFPDIVGKYREQLRRWEFNNGAMLHFCHCQYENDVFNYQGAEIHILYVDELTTMTEFIYDYLRARVRCTLKIPKEYKKRIPRIVCASNPGGIGHVFCRQRWVDYMQPLEIKRAPEKEGGMLRQFIPSKLQDNIILMERDPGYISRLDALPEPYRTAYKDGDWNIFFGQAFNFSREHHVIPPLETLPENYPLYMTFDWGFGKPFSIGWWCVDNDDRLIRFDEWYGWNGTPDTGLRLTDSQIAEGIIERELKLGIAGKDVTRIAGNDCFSKKPDYKGGGQGKSTSEVFADYGLYLTPGDPDRKLKFRQFRERLRVKEGETPMLVVTSNCEAFIRTIPLMQTDPQNPEEIDKRGEDHVLDDATLLCLFRAVGASTTPKEINLTDKLIDRIERPSHTPADAYEVYAAHEQAMDMMFWDKFVDGGDFDGIFVDTV